MIRRVGSHSGAEQQVDVLERIETDLLLEGIYRVYGYDFRQYALGSIRRRLHHRMKAEGVETLSHLQAMVLHDEEAMQRLLRDFSIPVTEMFRDPEVFLTIRKIILPELSRFPGIRIWHAGCSTGEEVYSMAMMLREEGLEKKATIYATDMNAESLAFAKKGIFRLERMQLYTHNYLRAGGRFPFSDYYSIVDGEVVFDPTLRKHVVFAHHNLATDHSFNEFHLILCRNVLIYFNTALQQRVLQLFRESLVAGGTLVLGNKEVVSNQAEWEELHPGHRLYRSLK